MSKAIVSLIAAVARNGIIGADNGLVWRLPSDLKHFKALTMGKPFVIGRKTFASIGRALPGRRTIVVTRNAQFAAEGVEVAPSIEAALAVAQDAGAPEIMIGGGGEIYAQTIGGAGRLYITEVLLEPKGESHFPAIDPKLWREVAREAGQRGPRDEADFAFVQYERID